MSMAVHITITYDDSILFGRIPKSRMSGSDGKSILSSLRNLCTLSHMVVLIYKIINSRLGYILSRMYCCIAFFCDTQSNWGEVQSHCGFYLHSLSDSWKFFIEINFSHTDIGLKATHIIIIEKAIFIFT